MPVMEGKAMLFKELAGIDAWPICLNTQDPDEIVRTVQAIAPGFGAINLEDISSPRCFEIERRLKASWIFRSCMTISMARPWSFFAALTNALTVIGKRMEEIRVVVNGLGAAGTACCRMLAGCRPLASDRMRAGRYRLTRGRRAAAGLPNGSRLLYDTRPAHRAASRRAQGGRCVYRIIRRQYPHGGRSGPDGGGSDRVCHGQSRP